MPIDFKKYKLFLPDYADVNYNTTSEIIIEKAKTRESFGVSALAVHGLMTSLSDNALGALMNNIDLIVPDGQPVRWALNSFYDLGMTDRVYGPELTLRVLQKANIVGLKVYLFGSTEKTITLFQDFISANFPKVIICGLHVDRFREATLEEDIADIEKINNSGANIVLVGRGCPRQEFWVASHKGKVNAVMMAVGAAFDFHAGTLQQAPKWMQNSGLEWFYRLTREPKRLWKRYLITNSQFIYYCLKYKITMRKPVL